MQKRLYEFGRLLRVCGALRWFVGFVAMQTSRSKTEGRFKGRGRITIAQCVLLLNGAFPCYLWSSTVIVGEHELLPNLPGQSLIINVVGGDPVSGIDLFVQIGDGGPDLSQFGLPSGVPGPAVTSIGLIEGTIFDGVSDVPTNIGSPLIDQASVYSLALVGARRTVEAEGILAKIVVDTTGFYGGEWDLLLSDVLPFPELNGPFVTNFAGEAIDIQNGKLKIVPSLGDFNKDEVLGAEDIDALTSAIHSGLGNLAFDVNRDGQVTADDRTYWVRTIARTYFGDSDLDGEFSSSDLVSVFQSREYEDDLLLNSTWSTGDWNGDGEFGSGDLVIAFQDRGFEQGPRRGTIAVPEPSCILIIMSAFVILVEPRKGVLA